MTKTVIFEDEITVATVRGLIDQIQPDLLAGDLIKLFFSSHGGDCYAEEILSEFLADWADSIILIGAYKLFSNGFVVFLNFPGEKRLLRDCMGMIHESTLIIALREIKKPNTYANLDNELLKIILREDFQKLQPLLTPDEQKRYLAGEDLYFHTDRLRAIFSL
ncbi:hypothetical protein CLV58_109151 [Spirosoma oryzae]|uniref:DUF4375 domain-containing protein n=1 Tax=Spirosoma oryzae TaxID=1469603 RepID=A0A2T0SYE4_9BACT|nr:hypothetical protein [Spirosoma oryzae]PRY38424.1 hypothetical protein CLV58_109151 [Spirosoma oryzae]